MLPFTLTYQNNIHNYQVALSMGMKIPADLRIVQCTGDCTFDRSILTGEVRIMLQMLRIIMSDVS